MAGGAAVTVDAHAIVEGVGAFARSAATASELSDACTARLPELAAEPRPRGPKERPFIRDAVASGMCTSRFGARPRGRHVTRRKFTRCHLHLPRLAQFRPRRRRRLGEYK